MRIISILLVSLIVISCEKDKFTTKPQLKYLSENTTNIAGEQLLIMRLDMTDKEGDFSSFLAIKKTVKGCPTSNYTDSTLFAIPGEFIDTKQTRGELVITLDKIKRGTNTCFQPGGLVRPDTTIFSFWTRDKAGNVSDTAYSQEIIIMP
ncbi:MAG: hypothetical protein JNK14_00660 [Chitinophagaceae bacterium]|nr:hypothetical protein [Chitinophagaceae bacterium]